MTTKYEPHVTISDRLGIRRLLWLGIAAQYAYRKMPHDPDVAAMKRNMLVKGDVLRESAAVMDLHLPGIEKIRNVSTNSANAASRDAWLYSFLRPVSDMRVLEANSSLCVVFFAGDELVFAFRGTRKGNLANMSLDAKTRMAPIDANLFPDYRVHQGFLEYYNALKKAVRRTCSDALSRGRRAPRKITFTGHSLGGAVAAVAAADICHAFGSPRVRVGCVSFSAPRVGNFGFTEWFASMIPDAVNVIVRADPIPRGYACGRKVGALFGKCETAYHAGRLFDLVPSGDYVHNFRRQGLRDHAIKRLLTLLAIRLRDKGQAKANRARLFARRLIAHFVTAS